MVPVNQALYDAAVSHQIGLTRYSSGVVRRIIALLNKVDPDLENLIRQRLSGVAVDGLNLDDATRVRLEQLLADIRQVNAEAYNAVRQALGDEMMTAAQHEADYTETALTKTVPVTLDLTTPTIEQLRAVVFAQPFQGRILKDWAASLEQGRLARISDALRIGMVEGETVDQLVKRVRGTRANGYSDGILEIDRRNAAAVVRTAVNHTTTRSRELLYSDNSDLVSAVLWVSVLDSRTTPICQARDGMVFAPNEGPRPPAHWNCRSTTAPVVRSWKELGIDMPEAPAGTRASMDGQVPAETTYQDWLKSRSAAEQDDILGPSRGLLFRKGGLSVDRFVDRAGRELTLDQLRSRDKAAFDRAGL